MLLERCRAQLHSGPNPSPSSRTAVSPATSSSRPVPSLYSLPPIPSSCSSPSHLPSLSRRRFAMDARWSTAVGNLENHQIRRASAALDRSCRIPPAGPRPRPPVSSPAPGSSRAVALRRPAHAKSQRHSICIALGRCRRPAPRPSAARSILCFVTCFTSPWSRSAPRPNSP